MPSTAASPSTRTAPRRRMAACSHRMPPTVFTPERLTDEQRMIAQTVTDFVNNEVLPALDRLEQKDWALARDLVRRAGQLGLLGVDVPEAYGGLQLDKITSMIVSERMSQSASFGATFGAQANSDDPAADALRQRRTETQVPAAASDGRADRRLLPQRARVGIRRARRARRAR